MTAFGETEALTVGMEEELQILDPDTGQLVSRVDEVLGRAGPEVAENLQSELFQAIVETATDVCKNIDEVREEGTRRRGASVDYTAERGYAIGAAGPQAGAWGAH